MPLKSPIAPMEARSVDDIPAGPEWQYEPKWDGFRCLVFREGERVTLQSKAGKPLTRYFPDVVTAVRALKAKQFVLDAEIAVPHDGAFSFDDLLQRIHPAQSRIQKLAAETPLSERRPKLEAFAAKNFSRDIGVRLSPATIKLADAKGWLKKVGATLDG